MNPDMAKLTAGLLLAQTLPGAGSPGPETPAVEWGLVGLICWMVIRELIALIKKLLDERKAKSKSECRDCKELIDLRLKVERLEGRVNAMGKK